MQDELAGRLSGGAADVQTDVFSRLAFSTDASIYQIVPMCVVRPRTVEDVAAVVRYAAEHGIAIAPRGAGSGLAGESLTPGIMLDLARHMNRIIATADDGSTVTVQPGVVLDDLNDHLARYGKKIGPDPSSGNRAVLGGVVANNATGAHSLQYGYIADWVERLQVVLADGLVVNLRSDVDPSEAGSPEQQLARRVWDLLADEQELITAAQPATKRNRCGYMLTGVLHDGHVNLSRLLVGSEGTLGIFTEITLRAVDVPRHKAVVQLEFETIEAMARAVPIIVESGAAACELMGRRLMELAAQALPQYRDLFPTDCAAVLFVEHIADEADALKVKIAETIRRVGDLSCGAVEVYDAASQQRLAKSRKDAVPLLNRDRGARHAVPFIEDVSVDNRRLAEYVMGMERIAAKHDIQLAFYGHAGDGELHLRPYLDLHDPEDIARMRSIAEEAFQLAWSLGGTISGEHAIGLVRTAFVRRQYGDDYWQLLRQIKELFDPKGLLNPGKIVGDDPDLMVKNFRARFAPRADRLQTQLAVDGQEFRFEIEQCDGCGVCLSCRSGSRMCPTFRALRDELAASRGKANLLRAWITGQIGPEELASSRFKEIISHCVNCKMCSVECPAGVDVSKLVIEARAQAVARRGPTRTEWVLARNRFMSRLSSTFAPLSNWVMSLGLSRRVMQGVLGLDAGRMLPAFQRGSFMRQARRRLAAAPPVDAPVDRVVYFVDTYANWNDHELGFAVLDVLAAAGVQVAIPKQRPVPLPALVYGNLGTARKDLAYNVRQLAPFAREGWTIVCSEPSAALCLREEMPSLLNGEDVQVVVEHTVELMDYLERLHEQGRWNGRGAVSSPPDNRRYAYHAPCHLCALRAQGESLKLLRRLCGIDVEDLDGGCCGLAGTFGMQRKNRDLAATIGRDLADRIAETDPDVILTECAACKMQIEHLTGKPVVHPVKLLAQSLHSRASQ